ncbi:MAG: hypothetical protein M0Z42_23335 [Actinomycetota bacterium]|nr:hypothetical protein [Actinomycetota bacterium]
MDDVPDYDVTKMTEPELESAFAAAEPVVLVNLVECLVVAEWTRW